MVRARPKKWPDFKQKYKKELKEKKELAEKLKQTAKNGALTLLYSAKDTERNNAVALKEFLEE